jgi:ABC-type phosphate transport system ATPase subunit
MEGDEMVELLRRAVAVVEERQDKLERLQEAIRLSSGSRRGEVIDRRIKLSADIIALDSGLRPLITRINDQIEEINEMLGALRGA